MFGERSSRGDQIKIYIGKCFRIFVNEKGFKSFISTAIIAILILGVANKETFLVAFGPTRSIIFALISGCLWIGIFNSIQSVCRERAIIKREHRTGLHISSYITAHMIYELVLCLIETAIITTTLFIMYDIPSGGALLPSFIELFITFFLVIYSSDILGMVISCIVKRETTAMTVMPFVLIVQLVMCGIIFPVEGAAADFIASLTISKWGVNVSCVILNVISMQDPTGIISSNPSLITSMESSAGNLFEGWFFMILFTVVYGCICVLSLKLIDKDKR